MFWILIVGIVSVELSFVLPVEAWWEPFVKWKWNALVYPWMRVWWIPHWLVDSPWVSRYADVVVVVVGCKSVVDLPGPNWTPEKEEETHDGAPNVPNHRFPFREFLPQRLN